VDWEHGDWHAEVLPDGRIVGEKAGIWKEPYHHGRALIEGLNLLGAA
jgi:mannose/cellobiose epimerase-like protein (N-acyl-D-glucosamine 2-epimerase family)